MNLPDLALHQLALCIFIYLLSENYLNACMHVVYHSVNINHMQLEVWSLSTFLVR